MLKLFKRSMSLFDVPLSTANSIYNLSFVVLLGGIALVLISTVSLIWSGMIKERYASETIAQNEAAAAQANAALQKAKADAAEASRQLTQAKAAATALEQETPKTLPTGREIPPEKRDLFKAFVKDSSKGKVFIGSVSADSEAANYARQISEMLTGAGYTVVDKTDLLPPEESPVGVHIRIKSMAEQPIYAGSLQKGLESIGIDTAGELDDAAEDSVLIIVGSKP
jgi:hypothetical protein